MSPSKWEQPTVYLQSGDPETENFSTIGPGGQVLGYPGQLGARFTMVNPQRGAPGTAAGSAGRSKRYQLVKTDSTMTVAPFPGATAYWGDKSQYVVTTNNPTNAYGRNRVAGRFCNLVTPGNITCVQIGGPGIMKLIDGVTQANVLPGAYVIADPAGANAKAQITATGTAPVTQPFGTVAGPLNFNVASLEVMVDLQIPETT